VIENIRIVSTEKELNATSVISFKGSKTSCWSYAPPSSSLSAAAVAVAAAAALGKIEETANDGWRQQQQQQRRRANGKRNARKNPNILRRREDKVSV